MTPTFDQPRPQFTNRDVQRPNTPPTAMTSDSLTAIITQLADLGLTSVQLAHTLDVTTNLW